MSVNAQCGIYSERTTNILYTCTHWTTCTYLVTVGRLSEGDGSIEEGRGKVHDSCHKLRPAAWTPPPSLSGHSKKSCRIRCRPILDTCSQGMKVVTNQTGTVVEWVRACVEQRGHWLWMWGHQVWMKQKYYQSEALDANIPLLFILFILLLCQASWSHRKTRGYHRTRGLKRNRQ